MCSVPAINMDICLYSEQRKSATTLLCVHCLFSSTCEMKVPSSRHNTNSLYSEAKDSFV